MTDETKADEAGNQPQTPEAPPAEAPAPAEGAATATAEEGQENEPTKLHQTVEIKDVGPCKKHIKVTVDRKDIDDRFGEKFSELVADATVSGFRPGKAPRKVVERRFQREVGDQLAELLAEAVVDVLALDGDFDVLLAGADVLDLDRLVELGGAGFLGGGGGRAAVGRALRRRGWGFGRGFIRPCFVGHDRPAFQPFGFDGRAAAVAECVVF